MKVTGPGTRAADKLNEVARKQQVVVLTSYTPRIKPDPVSVGARQTGKIHNEKQSVLNYVISHARESTILLK